MFPCHLGTNIKQNVMVIGKKKQKQFILTVHMERCSFFPVFFSLIDNTINTESKF